MSLMVFTIVPLLGLLAEKLGHSTCGLVLCLVLTMQTLFDDPPSASRRVLPALRRGEKFPISIV